MKKNKIISVFTILAISMSYSAASSQPKIWMEYDKSGHSIVRSVQGKKATSKLFKDVDITEVVYDNPQALGYARLSNSKAKTGKIWFWSYLSICCIAIGVPCYNIITDNYDYPIVNLSLLGTALVTSIVGGLVSESYFDTSRHYLFKSINTYNGIEQIEKEQSALLYKDLDSDENIYYLSWSYNL